MKEIWKDIDNYEGLYQVSNFGKIKNSRGMYLAGSVSKDGYHRVQLSKGGVVSTFKVHRLVAKAFVPNPENKEQVNHIDENKLNNYFENLEWSTAQENINHGTRNYNTSVTQGTIIQQFSLENSLIKEYHSMREAEKQTGIDNRNIGKACRGTRKTAGGFIWKIKNT